VLEQGLLDYKYFAIGCNLVSLSLGANSCERGLFTRGFSVCAMLPKPNHSKHCSL